MVADQQQFDVALPSVSPEVLEYWQEQQRKNQLLVFQRPLPAIGQLSLTRTGFRVGLSKTPSNVSAQQASEGSTEGDSAAAEAPAEAPPGDPELPPGAFGAEGEGDSSRQEHLSSAVAREMTAGETPFGAVGKVPGIRKWRIEKLNPVEQPLNGQFHTGDAYVVLNTRKDRAGNASSQDIHFWLGKEASKDEIGAAAILSAQLDAALGGTPTIYREVQEKESDEFLQMFASSGGVRYLKGGVSSGFNKVAAEKGQKTLFCVSGNRAVRISEVEAVVASLNSGSCFVLDVDEQLYQWNGKSAKPRARLCALDLAIQQRDDFHAGGVEISTLEETDLSSEASKAFFAALGCNDPSKAKISAEPLEDAADAGITLYKADASGGSPAFKEVQPPLSAASLEPKHVFVADGRRVVYVWVGGKAPAELRQQGAALGAEFAANKGRGDAQVKVVKAGLEPPIFKQQFPDWSKVMETSIPQATTPKKAAPEQDLAAVIAASEIEESSDSASAAAAAANGKLTVWLVRDFELSSWPQERHGEFYAADSFLVLNSYDLGGSTRHILYFWQGKDSSIEEKGSAAVLATAVDDELNGAAVQVRVVMNKEPSHFLALFKGGMVVYSGDAPAEGQKAPAGETMLFHCKGATDQDARAVQVSMSPVALNSTDAYALLDPSGGAAYSWTGSLASPEEAACAKAIAELLSKRGGAGKVEALTQGSESSGFWKALGGKDNVQVVEGAAAAAEPRLFLLSDAKTGGKDLWFEEIRDFSQEDLLKDDVMLLDAGEEVFVWVGPEASENEKSRAVAAAEEYIKASSASLGRTKGVSVTRVQPGEEPSAFTCHFLAWDSKRSEAFEDPYEAKLARLRDEQTEKGINPAYKIALNPTPQAPSEAKQLTAEEQEKQEALLASKREALRHVDLPVAEDADAVATPQAVPVSIPPDGSKTYPMEELKAMKVEDGIDCTVKEAYLSNEEFKAVFGKDKAGFAALPKWRQLDAKKRAGLF